MIKKTLFSLATVSAAVFLCIIITACDSDERSMLRLVLTANPESIPVNGITTITAQATNSMNQPVPGRSITWGTNFARLDVQCSTTDENGRCTAILRGQGVLGVATITADMPTGEHGQINVRIGF